MTITSEGDGECGGQRRYPRHEGREDSDEEDGKDVGADAEKGLAAMGLEVVGDSFHCRHCAF